MRYTDSLGWGDNLEMQQDPNAPDKWVSRTVIVRGFVYEIYIEIWDDGDCFAVGYYPQYDSCDYIDDIPF